MVTLMQGSGLLAVTIATFSTMFGPGMALRGPEGAASMHKAVDIMEQNAKHCFFFFMLALVFFHISSFLMAWIITPSFSAIIVNLILGYFLVLFFKNGYEIHKALHVTKEQAVTGRFENFAGYEEMPDLDRRDRDLTPPRVRTAKLASDLTKAPQGKGFLSNLFNLV